MRPIAQRFLLVAGLLLTGSASCNVYREIGLQEKVSRSDLVVIGTVSSISKDHCMELNSCATVKVLDVLKGDVSGPVRVLFNGEIAEMDPLCCKVGKSYLFFVRRVGAYYRTVNGPFGIYELP